MASPGGVGAQLLSAWAGMSSSVPSVLTAELWLRLFLVPPSALPDDLRSPIRIEREELRNLHFFPPEYGREWGSV